MPYSYSGKEPDRIALARAAREKAVFANDPLSAMASHFAWAPVAFAVTDGPPHTLRYTNAAFRELLTTGEIVIDPTVPRVERRSNDITPLLDRALRGEMVRDELLVSQIGNARRSCTAWRMGAGPSAENGLVIEIRDSADVVAIVERQGVLVERLLLCALREQDGARRAIEAERRAAFLAAASHDLARSLDEDTTRELVQRSALPRAGTWCIVDVIEPNGQNHRLAVVHPDSAKQQLAQSLADAWYPASNGLIDPTTVESPAGGNATESREVTAAEPIPAALRLHDLEVRRQVGLGALLIVPLVVHDVALGTITFVSPEGDDPFSADEITLAMSLADRCALALDNARLYRLSSALRTEAINANRVKSEFLRDVSHELRTPLYAIGGYVELLENTTRGALNAEQRSDLERIRYNQQHLARLISELIDFARIESGRVQYRCADVSVRAALADVAGLLDGAARERQLALDLRIEAADTSVWADADRVRQILLNLVMNAIKYTPVAGGNVSLGFSTDNATVLIQVSDCGPGISAEKLEAIFEQFVQLPVLTTSRLGGFGLGLGISRELARGMGGDLSVESTLGVGSRFTLALPRRRRA